VNAQGVRFQAGPTFFLRKGASAQVFKRWDHRSPSSWSDMKAGSDDKGESMRGTCPTLPILSY